MGNSVKKFEEIREREQMIPKKKAEKVLVRLGFGDVLITKEENEKFNGHVDLISEIEYDDCPVIASTEAYLIGYEDENGRECDEDGNYLSKDPNQTHIFFE